MSRELGEPKMLLVDPPTVDQRFHEMSGLQRAAEVCRYSLLCLERWASPHGSLREWLRRNLLLSAWLFIPAILVMPAITLILWQFTGWVSMLAGVSGRLIVLVLAFIVLKAFLKR